jgi:signal transduction histidine kinase
VDSRKASIDEMQAAKPMGWSEMDAIVTITVRDTGCGMPLEDLQRAFQPFFTTKALGRGTGLGLSLSREAVLAHGGDLTIESTVGKGTSVTVSLPGLTPDPMPVGRSDA